MEKQKDETPPKKYAAFSMRLTWLNTVALKKGAKSLTCRDDYTIVQFERRGIKTKGLHPAAVLYKKYLEEKPSVYMAEIFDNSLPENPLIYKVIVDKGRERPYEDRRVKYYDLETGKPIIS
jgi:hypothetical protein